MFLWVALIGAASGGEPETTAANNAISAADASGPGEAASQGVVSAPSGTAVTQPAEEKLDTAGTAAGQKPYEIARTCHGKVCITKFSNGHWRLLVDGLPFFIRGMEYSVDKVGVRPKNANEWMKSDIDNNGRIDGPYDSFIDTNKNNVRGADEKKVGDFRLLNEMGCNVIRIYHPTNINKKLLRDLYRSYGIYVIMGNFIGAYTAGSGAEWKHGTDYTDRKQKKKMKAEVKKMIKEFRNEPYVLMWMLGNENDTMGSYENSTFNNTNANVNPEAYASFVGELCRMIKDMDHNHPVAVCNGSYKMIPYYKKLAPEIDVIGMNVYSGPYGFGVLWNRVKSYFDRPVLITEYGCDCYNLKKKAEDEDFQALYHKRAWQDIEKNSFGGPGAGNSLGGVIFCWLDKWWLCGKPDVHDTDIGAWDGLTLDGKFKDEWMGMCGQGDGSGSPFVRQPRKVYYLYRNELWDLKYKHHGKDVTEQ